MVRASAHERQQTPSPSTTAAIVFVVADHAYGRRSLDQLISTTGVDVEHCSAEEFLSLPRPAVPCCLLLDVSLPGTNGLELQRQVGARMDMPIVFSGRPDARMSIQAMKAGAVDVLVEPVTPEAAVECHRRRDRAEPGVAAPRCCPAATAGLLRVAHLSRARGDGTGGVGIAQQAGGFRARHH